MRYLVVILALIAMAQSAAYVARMPPPPADGIGAVLAAYRSVAPMLPADGLIGFVETSADADLNRLHYYLAQHALAPRVLSQASDVTANVVVTTPGGPLDAGTVPRLAGFTLVGTGVGEIRVFRREPR
jgi:hypothetical protein